jgi:hypothetical protein
METDNRQRLARVLLALGALFILAKLVAPFWQESGLFSFLPGLFTWLFVAPAFWALMISTRRRGWLVACIAMAVAAAVDITYWACIMLAKDPRALFVVMSAFGPLVVAVATLVTGATLLKLRDSVSRRLGAASGVCLLVGNAFALLLGLVRIFGLPAYALSAVKIVAALGDLAGFGLLAVLFVILARNGVPQVPAAA